MQVTINIFCFHFTSTTNSRHICVQFVSFYRQHGTSVVKMWKSTAQWSKPASVNTANITYQ